MPSQALPADFITADIIRRAGVLTMPGRARKIARRWAASPTLRGRSVPEVIEVAGSSRHPDHNRVIGALLALSRNDPDGDEMMLLLNAVRPIVVTVDRADRYRDSRATMWTRVVHYLANSDPAAVTTSRVPYLVWLLGRARGDIGRRPSERVDRLMANPPVQSDLYRSATAEDLVERTALARLMLAACRQDPSHEDLSELALTGESERDSKWILRNRRRLASTVGYVA